MSVVIESANLLQDISLIDMEYKKLLQFSTKNNVIKKFLKVK